MELALLVAFMVVTIILMSGLLFIFRRWMRRREELQRAGEH